MRLQTILNRVEKFKSFAYGEAHFEEQAGGPALIVQVLPRKNSLPYCSGCLRRGRLYDHLKAVRARHGLTLIGWRNLRGLFKALRAGENLVLFCDGGYRAGDVPVEFLGEPTTFPTGPATLSARSGAPMLPVACYRTAGDRFTARGLPLIRATSDEPAEIFRVTQALADELGTVIAADPGQWYMFRPIWPQTPEAREQARAALETARRGEDWTRTATG